NAERVSAQADNASNAACAACTRLVKGKFASPRRPRPKVIVQTMVRPTMNAPAAANTGRQCAAGKSSKGKIKANGRIVNQYTVEKPNPIALTRTSARSDESPSRSSGIFGGSAKLRASPITNGATKTTPRASDVNQCNQVADRCASDLWNRMNPAVPPIPEI